MSIFRTSTNDSQRKANIVELLTKAANGGAQTLAIGGLVSGPLYNHQVRQALGISQPETDRLLCELVDATTIVRVASPNSDTQTWRYTV
jgi:hypothetical protein